MNKLHNKVLGHILVAVSLITFLGLLPALAHAEEEEVVAVEEGKEEYAKVETERKGFFAGAGPALGFEMSALKTVGGGANAQVGYRINNRFSVLLQPGLYYTRGQKVNYFFVPVLSILKVHFDSNFFLFAGGGYTYLWAARGPKFGGTVSTPSKSYHGWSVSGGAGYDFYFSFSKRFFASPQVVLDYTRIGKSNIIIPMAQVSCNWMF